MEKKTGLMKDFVKEYDEEKLKFILEIKEAYNNGSLSLSEARSKLRQKVSKIKPQELALAEQELKQFDEDECRKEDIQKMLELFDGLLDSTMPELPPVHPLMCYYRENIALEKLLLEIEDLVQYPVIKNQWLAIYDRLAEYKIHLSRKQNQLYSVLEQKGFDRPSTTMWLLDNFIRDEINEARSLIDADRDDEFIAMQETLVADLRDLKNKENTVLYPTSLVLITEEEFSQMQLGDLEIGFAFINEELRQEINQKLYGNSVKTKVIAEEQADISDFAKDLQELLIKHKLQTATKVDRDKLEVSTGSLTLEQINLIYRHMPVDISYVDENELVCFYTDTEHRVFPRSRNVIGRDVKNCHPRSSVHIVEEIIKKFRSGEQNEAEFWINKPDLFIYIYYVAVRDEKGKFRGVLEMMQDCTHIRSLEGSQTLLTWKNKETGIEKSIAQTDLPIEPIEQVKSDTEENLLQDNFLINENTKLEQILKIYPLLRDDLPKINDKFKMLQSPLARIMIKKADIRMMSEKSGMEISELIRKINEAIASYN